MKRNLWHKTETVNYLSLFNNVALYITFSFITTFTIFRVFFSETKPLKKNQLSYTVKSFVKKVSFSGVLELCPLIKGAARRAVQAPGTVGAMHAYSAQVQIKFIHPTYFCSFLFFKWWIFLLANFYSKLVICRQYSPQIVSWLSIFTFHRDTLRLMFNSKYSSFYFLVKVKSKQYFYFHVTFFR